MGYGDALRRARAAAVAAAAFVLALCRPPAAPASETALAARALPAALTLDESALPTFPASATLVEAGLCIEWAPPEPRRPPATIVSRGRASAVVGDRLRAALSADETSLNAIVASRRGWGVALAYKASGAQRGRVFRDPNDYSSSDESITDQRFEVGVGWRIGDDRLYELAAKGALYYERSVDADSTWFDVENDDPYSRLRVTRTHHDELGIGVTARSLSARAGPQVAFSLYLERPLEERGAVRELDQFLREARLDGAWRVTATGLDDLLVGASLSWADQATHVLVEEDHAASREEEDRETLYAGFVFFSAEKAIGSHVIVRAGGRAPARIGRSTNRGTNLDTDGRPGSIRGSKDAEGSVGDPEVTAGIGLRWRRVRFDAHIREPFGLTDPASQWSLTVLL